MLECATRLSVSVLYVIRKAISPGCNQIVERLRTIETLESRVLMSVDHPTFIIHHPINSLVPDAATGSPTGTTPASMRHAYAVDTAAFGSLVGDGTGQTIAIVDAYDEPTLAADLAAFDAQFGLAAPPSFVRVNQTGGTTLPKADVVGGWGGETSLDVEWAHVIAPKANILLVEATSASDANLYAAVDTARAYPGVSVVSMSWGGDEASTDTPNDSHFITPTGHAGVTFVASSGDAGAYTDTSTTSKLKIVGYPAVSPNVLGIGGTTLTTGTGGAWSNESGWGSGTTSDANGGSGGGISTIFSKPAYQSGVTLGGSFRTVPDVSLDADPNSGVPVYDKYDNGTTTPWDQFGGTSLASPMWAGVLAIANQGRVNAGLGTLDGPTETLPKIYALPKADFHDVTTGNNGYAAGTGYDLVTGLGTPIVNLLVQDLVGTTTAVPVISSLAVSPTSAVVSTPITLTATGVTVSSGTIAAVKFYQESNGTAGLQIGSDTLVGTGSQSGTTWTLGSTAAASAGTYTYYAVATDALNTSSATASTTLAVVASATPVIGGFSLSPATVIVGGSTVLTATGVSEIGGGTVTGVNFYTETNGTAGLQIGSDTLVAAGAQAGTTWTAPTTGAALGTYTYYAVATDAASVNSAVATATLAVTTSTVTGTVLNWNVAGSTLFGAQGLPATTIAGGVTNFYNLTGSTNSWTGKVEIGNGALDIPAATSPGVAAVLNQIKEAMNPAAGYTWTGPAGIFSAAAAADLTRLTTVGALVNNDGNNAVIYGQTGVGLGMFGNVAPALNDVLVKYTFRGDANLDGRVDGSDYTKIDNAFGTNASGWSNGDFNYDNVIDGSDYTLIDNAFNTQGVNVPTTVTTTTLTRGSGVTLLGTAAANAWGGTGWASTSALGVSGNKFVTMGLTVDTGYSLALTSVDMKYRRSATGPANALWQYQLNGGAWATIGDFTSQFSATSGAITKVDLSAITPLQSLAAGTNVMFRIVPYGTTNTSSTWYINDSAGQDLTVTGTSAATT